jgi:hypothetical protein
LRSIFILKIFQICKWRFYDVSIVRLLVRV